MYKNDNDLISNRSCPNASRKKNGATYVKCLIIIAILILCCLCMIFNRSWCEINKAEATTVQYGGTCGSCSWDIDYEGQLRIYPTNGSSGTLISASSYSSWPWYYYKESIKKVVVEDGVVANTNAAQMFYQLKNCTEIDLSGLDTSQTTNMQRMFYVCWNLTELDLNNFDTSNVRDMEGLFYQCSDLTSFNMSSFDTSNVTNMSYMFYGCTGLTTLDLGDLETDNVSNMKGMFSGCSGLTDLDVSNLNTATATTMEGMFKDCSTLTSLDLSTFDTSNVVDMQSMFYGCDNLRSLNLNNFNTSNVTNMNNMFYDCHNLRTLDLRGLNTNKVINMRGMFTECNLLQTITFGTDFLFKGTDHSFELNNWIKTHDINGTEILDKTEYTGSEVSVLNNTDTTPTLAGAWSRYGFNGNEAEIIYSGTCGTVSWKIDGAGTLTIYPTNGVSGMLTENSIISSDFWPWNKHKNVPSKVVTEGEIIAVGYIGRIFTDMDRCIEMDLSAFNTAGVTDLSGAFSGCNNLININVDNWNTENVAAMDYLFDECENLASVNLGNWNTKNVTDMSRMFYGCSKLTNIDVRNWDTQKVTDMNSMFNYCRSLTNLNTGKWNTEKVEDMSSMFNGCGTLTSLDVSNWNTGNVINMEQMFYDCDSLESLDVSKWNTGKVEDMSSMFYYCDKLSNLDVDNWNVGVVTNMSNMFYSCKNLISLNVEKWNVSNVSNMSDMFYNCNNLAHLNVENWKTDNVINMSNMFKNCNSLTNLNVSNWDTEKVTNMYSMFSGCQNLANLDISSKNITRKDGSTCKSWNTSNVTDISKMFENCMRLLQIDVSNFDTSKVTKIYGMFYNCESLTSLDVSNFDTSKISTLAGTVKDIAKDSSTKGGMFDGCKSLISLNISSKNITREDGTSYKSWDTSNITDMAYLFSGCSSLTDIDLNGFDTGAVTIMECMFMDCSKLKNLDLSSFNTSKVLNMNYMFENCSSLTSLNLSGFDTSSLYSSGMSGTFNGLSNLKKIVFSDKFVIRSGHGFIGSNVGNNWVKVRNLDGSKTYDDTEYNANDVALLTTRIPSEAGGIWMKYGIEESWYKDADGNVEFISVDENWIMNSDTTWTYKFKVFDNTLIYYLYEEIMDGYTSAAMSNSYIEVEDSQARVINTATNTNTGKLVISKSVEGIETNDEFEFIITLTGEDIVGNQIFNSVVFNNGVGKILLKHGESKTIELPEGTTFVIEESKLLNYNSSISVSRGTIAKDVVIKVNVVNTYVENPNIEPDKNAVNIKVKKIVENSSGEEEDSKFSINGYFTGLEAYKTYAVSNGNTFISDANGNAFCNISIEAGQEIVFYNIPEGARYQFTEQAGNYFSSYTIVDEAKEAFAAVSDTIIKKTDENLDKNKSLSTEKEVADKGERILITFRNVFDANQNLTIGKIVKVEQADGSFVEYVDCDESFEFTINFSNMNKNDTFTSTIGKVVSDESGEASKTFYLKHGQSVNFYDIPDGVRYEIIETENNYLATYLVEGVEVVSSSRENDKSNQRLSTEVEIVNKNENGVVTFTNIKEHNPELDVTILKIDNENNLLEGAILQIIDENGIVVEEWTSATEQHITSLREGIYTLHEKQAPAGYCVAKDIEFVVTKDNENKVVMVDMPLSVIVSSGGSGTMFTLIISITCACITCACMYMAKKKSKEDELE